MVRENRLSNGVRVYGEYLPDMRSVTIGIWAKAGSVMETQEQNGISHYIEHMLFKGTERRGYQQIAAEIDNIGGQANAFTAKEMTCYYVKVMDERLSVATDVLCDMFCHSVFDAKEMEKEKGVILEEIAMSNDNGGNLLCGKCHRQDDSRPGRKRPPVYPGGYPGIYGRMLLCGERHCRRGWEL